MGSIQISDVSGVAISNDRVSLTLPGTEIKVHFDKRKLGGGRLSITGFTDYDRVITRSENGSTKAIVAEIAAIRA